MRRTSKELVGDPMADERQRRRDEKRQVLAQDILDRASAAVKAIDALDEKMAITIAATKLYAAVKIAEAIDWEWRSNP